jgi:transcription antitermination factor NusG
MKQESQGPRWYVVHTYSGHENKVKANIEKLVESREMQDTIFEVRVPVEEVTEVKNGKKKVKERKMFPSYVIVKMIMTDESWYLVRNTRGVTGYLVVYVVKVKAVIFEPVQKWRNFLSFNKQICNKPLHGFNLNNYQVLVPFGTEIFTRILIFTCIDFPYNFFFVFL